MKQSLITDDDSVLIASFRNDALKEAAFSGLLAKYQQRLYWHIRRMVVDHDDTDDILQNVFIKIWRSLADFKEQSALYTWLYRIATNETLTWIEQKKKRAGVSLSGSEEYFAGKVAMQDGFDDRKIEWKLQQAVQQLPEKQRIVFSLRYYDEMPYEQMAEVLDTSVGALKASYHHAVKKVEAMLKNG